jgi:hypothetical protein
VFIRLTSTGGHARDPGARFYLNTEMIVSFERRSDHTFIALAEDFEKVKETPEEIFSQLASQHAPREKPLGDRFSE